MIVGSKQVGAVIGSVLTADRIYASPVEVGEEVLVAALRVAVDATDTSSVQPFAQARGVILDADGAVVGYSVNEVEVPVGSGAPQWLEFDFDGDAGPPVIGPPLAHFGIHVGSGADVLRLLESGVPGRGHWVATETYADGDPGSVTVPATTNGSMAVLAQVFPSYAPPTNETELYFASLPYCEARTKFSETAPGGTAYAAIAGWHGTATDDHEGSFCVIDQDGILTHLVGERLRITRRDVTDPTPVYAYCVSMAGILEDVSLTRQLWMELAEPAVTEIPVLIEVMA